MHDLRKTQHNEVCVPQTWVVIYESNENANIEKKIKLRFMLKWMSFLYVSNKQNQYNIISPRDERKIF